MTLPAKTATVADAVETALVLGDLSKLTAEQRVVHYNNVCQSLGLNPHTQPFSYITLNGKLTLYALRSCSDQMRSLRGVSVAIVSRDVANDILSVHVRATLPDGRVDEDVGAVFFPATLRGDARANAELKAITKAKRRVTLSICGLGWLDDNEVEDIPRKTPAPKENIMVSPPKGEPHVDPETGEVIEAQPSEGQELPVESTYKQEPDESERIAQLDENLASAAAQGWGALKKEYTALTPQDQKTMKGPLEKRHKPAAIEVELHAGRPDPRVT